MKAPARVFRRAPLRRQAGDRGWTLIELLVVLTIILILASLALTQYRNSVQLAKEAALRSDLFLMRDAIDQYYADKGRYPESLDTLVSDHYLRTVPRDPITNTADWQTIDADPQPGSLSASPGIIDIKSTSGDVGLDGVPYSEY